MRCRPWIWMSLTIKASAALRGPAGSCCPAGGCCPTGGCCKAGSSWLAAGGGGGCPTGSSKPEGGCWPVGSCWPAASTGTVANASAASSARHFARRVRLIKDASTELSRDVVEQCNAHQQDEQRHAQLLADGLETFRQRAALEPLDGLKDDLAAVEDRDWQQVHKSEGEADDHQKLQKRGQPKGRGIPGVLGDAERAAPVLDRHLPDQHAPEQAPLQRGQIPGLDVGARERRRQRQADMPQH